MLTLKSSYVKTIDEIKLQRKLLFSLTIGLVIFFIILNNTVFSEKLKRDKRIIFDYTVEYRWSTLSKDSLKFNELFRDFTRRQRKELFIENLASFHSHYFELIYKFNLDDLKSSDFKNLKFKLAESFSFDTLNFQFKNRKLHLTWSNIDEAKDYLNSLHLRAFNRMSEYLQIFLNEDASEKSELITKNFLYASLNFDQNNKQELNSNKILNSEIINKIEKKKVEFNLKDLALAEIFFGSYYNKNYVTSLKEIESTFDLNRNYFELYLLNKFNYNEFEKLFYNYYKNKNINIAKDLEKFYPKFAIKVKKLGNLYIYLFEAIFIILILIITSITRFIIKTKKY